MVTQIFQRCRNPLNILDAISVKRSKFNNEDPQILAPNYKIYLLSDSGPGIFAPALECKNSAENLDLFLLCHQSHLLTFLTFKVILLFTLLQIRLVCYYQDVTTQRNVCWLHQYIRTHSATSFNWVWQTGSNEVFVGRGTPLDKGDKNGDTPLLLAAGHSKLEAFRFLKETGADINIRDA